MKKLLTVLICLIISGCGHFDRAIASYTGYSNICIDNVQYIQFTSGATVAYDANGKIKVCN